MRVAIVGFGLIGQKRAKALGKEHELIIVADKNIEKAKIAANYNKNCLITSDWQKAASHKDIDMVIVSTTNDLLTPIGIYSLKAGKHVLIEKPGAKSLCEIESFVKEAAMCQKKVKVGFSLRYHPALMKAKEILESGVLGELMFIRGRYGHGGRIGYDKEWRADPNISGGGEMLDQGVHLIDLSRWFLGEFQHVSGFVNTYFWKMPVDDNGFMSLRTHKNQMAWLHVSCSEWKNMFCLEIYGKNGKLQIDGLGGSYGVEKLTYYKMLPEMGPPETQVWDFPGEDDSWKKEFSGFVESVEKGSQVNGGLQDACEALKIVKAIYKENNYDYC